MADDKVVDQLAELELADKKPKKKKKSKDKDEGAENAEMPDLNLGEKKKKKKKEKKAAEDDTPDLDLGDKKKKKKKKDKSPAGDDDGAGDAAPDLDLSGTKKKEKKNKTKKSEAATAKERQMEELDESMVARYEYGDLLARVFDLMDNQGVGKGAKGSKRIVCKPPQMVRIGTKKSGYQNFGETAKALNRSVKHVMQYTLMETGTSGNMDGDGKQLTLRGRFKPSHMENVLREYIKEYVQCATCKSANTILEKLDRLTFMICNDCSSRRTVQAMTTGYQALVGKRKKQREKGGAGVSNAMKAQ